MDFSLNDEQRAWQMKARKFAAEHIRPRSLKREQIADPKETWDWDLIRLGSEQGFRTLVVPKKYGGHEVDFVTQALVMAELAKFVTPETIVVGDASYATIWVANYLRATKPGARFITPRGLAGIGWGFPLAIGAKLAAPNSMCVRVVGDGGFYFGGPSSVFSVAQQYKLPILVLLLDNTGWSAVKESTLRVFPQGEAKTNDKFRANLMPDADFSKVGEAFGAHVLTDTTAFLEPAWKMILSNKGILPLLWAMFPKHPNLLPAYFEERLVPALHAHGQDHVEGRVAHQARDRVVRRREDQRRPPLPSPHARPAGACSSP